MELIARIKKLLALAESSNENEAALAAARAQELLDQHRLSLSEFDAKLFETENPVDESELSEDFGRYRMGWIGWKRILLGRIARLNGCTLLYGYSLYRAGGRIFTNEKFKMPDKRRITIVGRESDRQIVEYLSAYLTREIERLAKVAFEKKHGTVNYRSLPNWTTSFALGAIQVIVSRMMTEHDQAVSAIPKMYAVVRRDDAAVTDWIGQHCPHVSSVQSRSNARLSQETIDSGREAGRQIEWHSAVRSGAKPPRLLTKA